MPDSDKLPLLSVLIPFYNEEEQIPHTLAALTQVLGADLDARPRFRYEIIACDDGSTDASWSVLTQAGQQYPMLRCLRFSRNFGKESAILALLQAARGDCAVLMDGDLQHPPAVIPAMLDRWFAGVEVVDGVKKERQNETAAHRFAARTFYRLFHKFSGIDLRNASDFKLLDRKAIDAYLSCPEREPFFRALSAWIGYRREALIYEVADREHGTSKWSARNLARFSLSAISSFSSSPLQIISVIGCLFWIFALILGIQTIIHWARGRSASGFTTVILILLITGGAIMLSLGLIGSYLGRIYTELKHRPRYLISERLDTANTDPSAPGTLPASHDAESDPFRR